MRKFFFTLLLAFIGSVWMASHAICTAHGYNMTDDNLYYLQSLFSGTLVETSLPCDDSDDDNPCPDCTTVALLTNDSNLYYLTGLDDKWQAFLDSLNEEPYIANMPTYSYHALLSGREFNRGDYRYIAVNTAAPAQITRIELWSSADWLTGAWEVHKEIVANGSGYGDIIMRDVNSSTRFAFFDSLGLMYQFMKDGTGYFPPHAYTLEHGANGWLLSVEGLFDTPRNLDDGCSPLTLYRLTDSELEWQYDCYGGDEGPVTYYQFLRRCQTDLPSPNAYLPSLCDEWHYVTYYAAGMDIPATPVYYSQHLAADTVIGEHKYRQLRGRVGYRYSSNDDYLGALREGDNADIYYVPTDSTHEYLLYAFNANVGDTLKNLWMGTDMQCTTAIITEISTGRLRTFQAKVHVIVSGHYFEDFWELWTDSVGSATSEGPAGVSVYMLNTPYLACACKDGRKIYVGDANCACDPLRLKSLCDTWNIHGVAFPDGHDHHLMFTQQLTTDTLIAGQRYVRLEQGSAYLGALRETDNARIYFIPAGSTHEYLLYAFHANQGDTFDNVWFGGRPSDFPNGSHVTIREITEQNGRKVFKLDASYTTPYEEIVEWPYSIWIEGVGLQDGPAGSDCPLDCLGDYGQSVLCAYKDGVHVYASAFAEEHGCWYTTDDQIDTIPLYVNDGPGSTTVTPVDPNQVVATLNDNLLTIREQSGEEVTYSLAVTPISHAPARHALPAAQKEVSSGNFRNSVAVQLSEDGSYTLTLSKAGWENDIYGSFDYTASGLQPIAAPDAPARKLLRNGQLLIQQGDKIFTLTGVQTK